MTSFFNFTGRKFSLFLRFRTQNSPCFHVFRSSRCLRNQNSSPTLVRDTTCFQSKNGTLTDAIDFVENASHPERTKSDTGRVATDSDTTSDDSNLGNSTVNDLVDSVEQDDLANMSAQKAPQKSDVSSAKYTDEGNASGNNDVGNIRPAGEPATKLTNQEGTINPDLNSGPGRQGRA